MQFKDSKQYKLALGYAEDSDNKVSGFEGSCSPHFICMCVLLLLCCCCCTVGCFFIHRLVVLVVAEEDKYFERMCGFVSLYAAIVQTEVPPESKLSFLLPVMLLFLAFALLRCLTRV